MHEILLPRNRIARIRATYRHPDQAAILARLPIAGRRVPFRQIWRGRSVDPRRMLSHGKEYVREHIPSIQSPRPALRERIPAVRDRLPAVRDRLPAVRERAGDALHSPAAERARMTAMSGIQTAKRGAAAGARTSQAAIAKVPRRPIVWVAGAFALGALLTFLLDSHSGRRRRALIRDKVAHGRRVVGRDLPRIAQKRLRFLGGIAKGVSHNAADIVPHHLRRGTVDDETLVARVRSEALRGHDVKAGEIHVDAYEGCVTLRGQLEHDDEIRRIVVATGRIEGVTQVRSYLHLPGTPPPNKAEALVNGHMPETAPR
jgi:hypothetical protein